MKKIYAVAAALLLIITSCSSDQNPENNGTDAVLLTKKIEQSQNGTIVTTLYQYDGEKLVAISNSAGQNNVFTYTGDQITKVEHTGNNEDAKTTEFTYDDEGRVSEMLEYGFNTILGEEGEVPVQEPWANRTTYAYNDDGTITLVTYAGDHESQTEVIKEGTLTVANGNVTAYTSASGNSAYTFDGSNNPEMNITGISPVNIAWQLGGINNITAASHSNGSGSYTATYTYDQDGYPLTGTKTDASGTTQIWYLY
ncbi:hypothetical protein HYN59_08130 [Flavobacterium album]|uniref:DUF4595 domain-containing protein n=1 Tax=Flavobacterium album TaxID=2175091 RepID=A0A2S1QXI5_9FLAO|nr:hypothetical protein [Flavobacterium album]AWH85095.1 hypothetical protein HYN59_08130 [Flavobacterium album]